ncbi:DUF3558 domain-containing protein [Streptomyces sp. ML-6]|uniref:DUF3558 domain-containing protein n=1 Tax=Streptomyces sp. ML-6 TaxID=2982693 RepID=UPI0024C02674|nr:DUF3558 domain-containing protein [Streptomyces sp. ML-6]MDK0520192.1 DUF3558 domain-containing protein [Streptomyces sp. ML-6]
MAYVPGAALLAALVVGCSADTGTGGSAADSKPGEATEAVAAPGKYRTLPEPCRAVASSTLRDLLPGSAELSEEQQKKVYEGTATVTYDTDRRVGCRWKSEDHSSSRTLFIDFERVVSYDPSVSDDDRANEVYTKKVTAAGLSSPSASASPDDPDGAKKQTPSNASDHPDSSGADDDAAGPDDSGSDSGAASHSLSGPPSGDESPSGKGDAHGPDTKTDDPKTDDGGAGAEDDGGEDGEDGEDLRPRMLDDLGDSAFLNDLLTRAGSAARHRTVSVVFRTSNVIVTVEYTDQPTVSTVVPDSKELQEKAQALARNLVEEFDE